MAHAFSNWRVAATEATRKSLMVAHGRFMDAKRTVRALDVYQDNEEWRRAGPVPSLGSRGGDEWDGEGESA